MRGERSRAEVPILVRVADTVLRGTIDLLVERPGSPPLIVDFKTDRLDGADPAELAGRYEIQQAIYALAVAEALDASEVELAYVFLERPEEPVLAASRRRRDRGGPSPARVGDRRGRRDLSQPAAEASSFSASSSSRSSLRPSPTASSSAAQ